MLLFDALMAGLVLKIFGENAFTILGVISCIAFLRMAGKLNLVLNALIDSAYENVEEEEN